MSLFIWPPLSVSTSAPPIEYVYNGANTQVSQDTGTPSNSRPLPTIQLDSNGNPVAPLQELNIVDFPDVAVGPLYDCSVNQINGSAGAFQEIVASLAAAVKKIQWQDDIGQFIGVYTGAAASEVLACIIGPGGSAYDIQIPAGTRISIRSMNAANITSGQAAITFLG